jgi:hypothetical protein
MDPKPYLLSSRRLEVNKNSNAYYKHHFNTSQDIDSCLRYPTLLFFLFLLPLLPLSFSSSFSSFLLFLLSTFYFGFGLTYDSTPNAVAR